MVTPKNKRTDFSLSDKPNIKKLANKEERKFAKETNSMLTPNSGSTPFLKGDMFNGDVLIDMKSALVGKSVTVDEKMLRKLEQDGVRSHKQVALILNFTKSKDLTHKRWILTPYAN